MRFKPSQGLDGNYISTASPYHGPDGAEPTKTERDPTKFSYVTNMINTDFTATMEEDLDRVESGEKNWRKVVANFHDVFIGDLEEEEGAAREVVHRISHPPRRVVSLTRRVGAAHA